MTVRHVVLDRDGVLNVEGPSPVGSVADWRWERGAEDALSAFAAAGVAVSVVTNQSAIGAGTVEAAAVEAVHRWLVTELTGRGVRVVGVFVCPHRADDGCRCRKPLPGLVTAALRAGAVPSEEAVLVGDDRRDLLAATAAGIRSVLVRTGKGRTVESEAGEGTPVVDDLAGAAALLLGEGSAGADGQRSLR